MAMMTITIIKMAYQQRSSDQNGEWTDYCSAMMTPTRTTRTTPTTPDGRKHVNGYNAKAMVYNGNNNNKNQPAVEPTINDDASALTFIAATMTTLQ
jgi:hypothetical protein